MTRSAHRGSIVITMVLIVALLGGGAILLAMQLQSSRSDGSVREKLTGLHCAEAGLASARAAVAANVALWNGSLCNPPSPHGTGTCVIGAVASEPAWLAHPGIDHDLDGDGAQDFTITLVDNNDASDMTTDADSQIFIASTCTKPEARFQVLELVSYDAVTGKLLRKAWVRSE